MKVEYTPLIEVLREELVLYGEALALLEQQRELIVQHAVGDLLDNVESISVQFRTIGEIRAKREEARRTLALAHGLPESISLRRLIVVASVEYRPLLEALVEEINDLLVRSQNRLVGNNLLLRRAVTFEMRAHTSSKPVPHGCRAGSLMALGCRMKFSRVVTSHNSAIAANLLGRKRIQFHSEQASPKKIS
jgi:hypothetical protein